MVSTLEQMQVPNGTGPGVRRSKRPLLASRTRCNVLWKPPKFGNKVKIGNKVQFGNRFANWCNAWSIEGVIVYGHVPECHVTFGRGRLHNVWWDPISSIKLPQGRFQTFHDISLSEELRWKSCRPKNKTFIRGASPGISYELWDKNTIGWRRRNIATQERKVCDVEVEIVTSVVKGSAQLTVTLDRQE